jgi:endonuclease III
MKPRRAAVLGRLLSLYPTYAETFGIDLAAPRGRFTWFVASLLFGAPIGGAIVERTFRALDEAGVLEDPEALVAAGWDRLVALLDSGGYARYDFSTATKLLDIAQRLIIEYGDLETLRARSADGAELESRLREFKGIGPATAGIFLRELRAPWGIERDVCESARGAADRLGLDLGELGVEELTRAEAALVQLHLHRCKKGKCGDCPVAERCAGVRDTAPGAAPTAGARRRDRR